MGRQKILVLSWEQFFLDSVQLSKKIIENGYRPDILVAIARGGWVLGRILSDLLSVRDAVALTMKFYEEVGSHKERPVLVQELNVDLRGRKVLLVDDIVDSGATLREAVNHLRKAEPLEVRTATLYVKTWSPFKPDFYVKELSEWVVFPYELKETYQSLGRSEEYLAKMKEAGISEEILREILGTDG
ncbi:phosphoribosyltransferase [Thermofilum pendens]|uniref:Phosphoribosyltransferase n=1 Tax=Thermofilum pendens (strain DSM 2475 / Hrk 5) TaxID=368408 RepID=A1RX62_THEPD|nr:phosphoribosyltransferase [Thermofilum pendens]ABL77792.1 phosphoribosyltransferase [Thermofilum pendens Hrk 5]